MGFLNVKGSVLTYSQYKQKIEQYKKHGLLQFLSVYDSHKDRFIELDQLKWGEEMEYHIYSCEDHKTVRLSNNGPKYLNQFNEENNGQYDIQLMPEFGGWMVEAVPKEPYQSISHAEDLLSCVDKLSKRREILRDYFKKFNIMLVSMPNAPSLGTPQHIMIEDKELALKVQECQDDVSSLNTASRSQFVIDQTINTHPRFAGLVKSIREHRGSKVEIRVPLFKDEKTNMTEATKDEPFPGEIYMDAMHFGMGQCCLQITYECQTMNHARYLYDQLLPFTGFMAALSASGPVQKGKISDNDLRWTVIEQCVDCRNEEERDPNNKEMYIPKSRYSAVNHYISNHEYVQDSHNDAYPIKYNQDYKNILQENTNIDDRMAEHVARLFTRDPVPAYEGEFIEDQIDDKDLVSHFENLQSTNWNSLRFKPPPSQQSKIGWRVEFRTMDIQLTDFENSALTVALGLIVNVINHFDVDFIMPVTMCDINMKRAHHRDALIKEKFWFKTNCVRRENFHQADELQKSDYQKSSSNKQEYEGQYHELYIHEILAGKEEIGYLGIFPLIRKFMEVKKYSEEHINQIEKILNFLMARSSGEVPTGARWIRDFIAEHPLYNKDSLISSELNTELMQQIIKLNTDVACYCELDTSSDSCASNQNQEERKQSNNNSDELFDAVGSAKKVQENSTGKLLWSREYARTKLLGNTWGKVEVANFNLKVEENKASESLKNQIQS